MDFNIYMSDFQGITQEYRETQEYKEVMKCIKQDFPNLPDFLAEMAIGINKNDPKYWRSLRPNVIKTVDRTKPKLPIKIPGSVRFFKSIDDAPVYESVDIKKFSEELINAE